jgi:lipopolysaccharide/colanic/teichoic acid biosynthesis glycosyltransferase
MRAVARNDIQISEGGIISTDRARRAFDLLITPLLIIAAAPLIGVIAALIKLMDGGGSVFFLQKRCGRNGAKFRMYKFRTMKKMPGHYKKNLTNDVSGPMFKMKNDPRVTNIGRFLRKWSLDELPQLFNVLKGEMGLVGPRPLARKEMAGHDNWRTIRLLVRPGITGLWQIYGRGSSKFDDWIKYDIQYVQERSVWLDIKILFMTFAAVVCRNGAH